MLAITITTLYSIKYLPKLVYVINVSHASLLLVTSVLEGNYCVLAPYTYQSKGHITMATKDKRISSVKIIGGLGIGSLWDCIIRDAMCAKVIFQIE